MNNFKGKNLNQILLQLKDEITTFEFENYINQITYNEKYSREDRIVLNAPNVLIASWVKTKYADKIAHLFEINNGLKPEIIVEVANSNKRKKTKVMCATNKTEQQISIPLLLLIPLWWVILIPLPLMLPKL